MKQYCFNDIKDRDIQSHITFTHHYGSFNSPLMDKLPTVKDFFLFAKDYRAWVEGGAETERAGIFSKSITLSKKFPFTPTEGLCCNFAYWLLIGDDHEAKVTFSPEHDVYFYVPGSILVTQTLFSEGFFSYLHTINAKTKRRKRVETVMPFCGSIEYHQAREGWRQHENVERINFINQFIEWYETTQLETN